MARTRVLVASVLAIGGASFAIFTIGRTLLRRPAPVAQAALAPDVAASAAIASIDGDAFVAASGIADGGADRWGRLRTDLARSAPGAPSPEALATIAARMLSVYASPSYDEYLSLAGEWAGRSAAQLVAEDLVLPRELWESAARPYERAEFALEHATVERVRERGATVGGPVGGEVMSMTKTLYSSTRLEEVGDAWDVVVPVRLAPHEDGSEGVRVFLRLSFVRRASDGRWVPVRATAHAPDESPRPIPVPWL